MNIITQFWLLGCLIYLVRSAFSWSRDKAEVESILKEYEGYEDILVGLTILLIIFFSLGSWVSLIYEIIKERIKGKKS